MYALTLLLALTAQRPDSFTAGVREYITVDTSVLALTHVLLVDGTGAAPKTDQTIIIRAGKIAAVGPAASVQVPAGAKVMDMSGSTVIPGIVGMHDHLFYTAAGGRAVQMSYTGPRLYLGSGVTTIRTTGSRAPYAEINLKDLVDHGRAPGPHIHLTAPYITGEQGRGSQMAIVNSPEAARRFVDYWVADRPTKDSRVLEAMDPGVRESYMKMRNQIDSSGTGWVSAAAFKNAMAFERAFVDAGGLLAAGVDPTGSGGALAGFGDQRNYELFIEAGLSPAQAVQIMTSNGAKILGVAQQLGSVETGKMADLVVLHGDLTADPSVIRSPTIVFKDGVGYDSAKLLASVQGRVGVN